MLAVTDQTADIFGDVKHELHAAGQMIPDNDIWISATARQYGLILVTRDIHFNRIKGLVVEQW